MKPALIAIQFSIQCLWGKQSFTSLKWNTKYFVIMTRSFIMKGKNKGRLLLMVFLKKPKNSRARVQCALTVNRKSGVIHIRSRAFRLRATLGTENIMPSTLGYIRMEDCSLQERPLLSNSKLKESRIDFNCTYHKSWCK